MKPTPAVAQQGRPVAAVVADHQRLSIIIPALNEAECIVGTLDSLRPLRSRGHEVIVVDGGSVDSTVRLCEQYADRIIRADRGRARQMNAGAKIASGDIFWFVHADTRVPETADRHITASLAAGKNCWGRFDIQLADQGLLLDCIAWSMNLRSRLTGIATGDQGIFMTRTAYERIGGYEDIPLMEDIAASRALGQFTRPAAIRTTLLTSARRWRRHGIIRTIFTMWCLRLGYFFGVSPQRISRYYSAHSS